MKDSLHVSDGTRIFTTDKAGHVDDDIASIPFIHAVAGAFEAVLESPDGKRMAVRGTFDAN